jgi:hypothetical protein
LTRAAATRVLEKAQHLFADQVMRGTILLGCHHGLADTMLQYIHPSFESFAAKYEQ